MTGEAAPAIGSSGVVIETARLRMRAHRDDDLADLVALAGNWEIARWVATIPHPYTEVDGREWIARVQENHATGTPRRFAIALKETDRLIGGVGLDGTTGDGSDEPALGYWLGQPYWGNGYAREAAAAVIHYGFRTLGLETIRAYTDQATRHRKRFCCVAASNMSARSSCSSRRVTGNAARRCSAYFARSLEKNGYMRQRRFLEGAALPRPCRNRASVVCLDVLGGPQRGGDRVAQSRSHGIRSTH